MVKRNNIKRSILVLLCNLTMWSGINAFAQQPKDSITVVADSASTLVAAKVEKAKEVELSKTTWKPDPKRALWMALVIPGGGQIYNHKYWKLPFVYGGFMGCAYALSWNNMMYRDYSKAYVDLLDDDPNTKSYQDFLSVRYKNDSYVEQNKTRLTTLFKKKKNYFRRYRDLSMFCVVGVYLLSVVDAYVDAELSSFDISKDLSLKVEPTIIGNRQSTATRDQAYGLQCSLNF